MTDAYRTPDERFEGLPGFPWEPHHREWDGLRLAHIDEGADSDPIIPPKVGARFAERINADPPEMIENASHFLQEDVGEEIGARIASWLSDAE